MKKIFRKPIFAILIAISLILVVAGGAYAAFAPQNLTGQGTITVNAYNYSYALTESDFNFGVSTISTTDSRFISLSCPVTISNNGESYIDGLDITSVTYPAGLNNCALSVSLSGVIFPSANGVATFTLVGIVPSPSDTVQTIDLSSLICTVMPTGYIPSFTADLSKDTIAVSGTMEVGFTVQTDGNSATNHVLDIVNVIANPALTDAYHPFKLVNTTADLTTYFHAKGWPQNYVDQIDLQIDGTAPFFFIKDSQLVDGFKKAIGAGDNPLVINGDYPTGTYIYEGEITDVNGATRTITVTMYVIR